MICHLLNPSKRWASWTLARPFRHPRHVVSRQRPGHTEALLEGALKDGAKRLIVWGGDGTFHRVVRSLWERKKLNHVELALVPAGTCNDLARRLKLTRVLWREWEKPKPAGRLAKITLAQMTWGNRGNEKDIFVNNAGFGRPRVSFEKKEGAWGTLKSFQPLRVKAVWPEGELKGLYYMALACNGPYFSGGLYFERDISPEDDRLRCYFVPATSKPRLASRLVMGRLGLSLFDSKTTKITAAHLSVETQSPVWPQADGEPPPLKGVRRVGFDVLPERVPLWVPA